MKLKLIKRLCAFPTEQLERLLYRYLWSEYDKVVRKDNYMFAEGNLPICLIAHMDTVFRTPPDEHAFFFDARKRYLWAPFGSGFDDRAGVYAIVELINRGYLPSIIFTNLEEVGGVGASELVRDYPNCPFEDCRCLIELDRANRCDSVFYQCDNKDFENYINKYGFITEIGSFSDISVIAPAWGIAAVNLSIGYEDEHTGSERLNTSWCDQTIDKVEQILIDSPNMMSYGYIPKIFNFTFSNATNIADKIDEELPFGFQDSFHHCLLCGEPVGENGIKINDPEYPYVVCKKCYDEYYDAEGNYIPVHEIHD